MLNYFYSRKSKSWRSENDDYYILKLGSTRHIQSRKWWGCTERLYPSYYVWYLHITNLGRFPNLVSAEKTIFNHPFFSSRNIYNGEGSGEEFFSFHSSDNPLEKACEILIQYDAEFSVLHGDTFTTRPPTLIQDSEDVTSQPLPPITKLPTKSLTTRPYQIQCVESMLGVDKGILILATGTGKTVIYSLYIQKCKGRYLIVVPTTTLVTQTVTKCKEILGDTFRVFEYKTDMKLPSRVSCKDLVMVGTYQNSHNIRSVEDIDCIFFDECHSTVILKPPSHTERGLRELSRFQKLLDYPCKKKFFGTATEKNITSHTQKPISMDDEKIYGPVLYKYTLAEAISEGYLTDYTFDLVGTADKKEICIGYIKSGFKSLIFCSNLESVRQLYNTVHEALKTTSVKVYKLGEKEDVDINTKLFSEYKSQAVLISCRKINIGYDEPQIDTVIHYDISTSSIMTIQRTGRGLRLSPDKVMAKIVFLCDLSGDAESQKEEIKKLEAPISYLQLHDSRLRDRIAKELSKPSGLYKSINVKLQEGLENVKVYDRFWNLLSDSIITYNQCKELIRRANPRVVSIREYAKLCDSEPRLPLNPEETFDREFKGWVDYLSVDVSHYYSEERCRELIRRCYDQISHIPELSKRCKALRKTDPKFPPPDMWVHVYRLSSLEVIFTNTGSKVSISHDIDSLLK